MQSETIANQMDHLSVKEQPKKQKTRWSKARKREQAAAKSVQQDQHAVFPSPLDNDPRQQPRHQQQEPNLVRYVPSGQSYPDSSYRSQGFRSINPTQRDYPPPAAPQTYQPPTFQPINRHPSSFFVPSYANYLPPPPPPPPFPASQNQQFFPPPLPFFTQPFLPPELPALSNNASYSSTHRAGRPQVSRQGNGEVLNTNHPRQQPQDTQDPEVRTPRPSDKRARAIGKLLRPAPSLPYLVNSLVTSPKLDQPRSLLVVLDLNGVLAIRKKRTKSYTARPQLATFLDYLFANHHVMIWSSGMPENVERIMARMLSPERQQKLVAIWSRDKLRLPAHLFGEKVQVYKQLSWIWGDPTLQLNAPVGGWSQRDTVLIDDSIDKAAAEPYNLIEVDEYTGIPAQNDNMTLLHVIAYLERIRWYENVSAEMRAAPFVVPKP
ncbi:HAD-like protein [Aureobasidium sp. EXF-12298]|nr:HAD-like protein [Aureobasidium sp. EXF-12298]